MPLFEMDIFIDYHFFAAFFSPLFLSFLLHIDWYLFSPFHFSLSFSSSICRFLVPPPSAFWCHFAFRFSLLLISHLIIFAIISLMPLPMMPLRRRWFTPLLFAIADSSFSWLFSIITFAFFAMMIFAFHCRLIFATLTLLLYFRFSLIFLLRFIDWFASSLRWFSAADYLTLIFRAMLLLRRFMADAFTRCFYISRMMLSFCQIMLCHITLMPWLLYAYMLLLRLFIIDAMIFGFSRCYDMIISLFSRFDTTPIFYLFSSSRFSPLWCFRRFSRRYIDADADGFFPMLISMPFDYAAIDFRHADAFFFMAPCVTLPVRLRCIFFLWCHGRKCSPRHAITLLPDADIDYFRLIFFRVWYIFSFHFIFDCRHCRYFLCICHAMLPFIAFFSPFQSCRRYAASIALLFYYCFFFFHFFFLRYADDFRWCCFDFLSLSITDISFDIDWFSSLRWFFAIISALFWYCHCRWYYWWLIFAMPWLSPMSLFIDYFSDAFRFFHFFRHYYTLFADASLMPLRFLRSLMIFASRWLLLIFAILMTPLLYFIDFLWWLIIFIHIISMLSLSFSADILFRHMLRQLLYVFYFSSLLLLSLWLLPFLSFFFSSLYD